MRRYLATFGGAAYESTVERTVRDAPGFGVDQVVVYDDVWLRAHPFATLNAWLFNLPNVRGLCWFAFKPLVVMDALERFCEPGDCLLFLDGDTYPIADLTPLYERCVADGGQMLFSACGCSNRQWVKRDCWLTMSANWPVKGRRAVEFDSQHAVARFMLFQKGHWHVQQFLMEWLTYCLNPLATTFEPSVIGLPEYKGFEQHRTEQAILSLLAHKYGYHLSREACQFGNAELAAHGTDSWYPQLFVQEGARSADTHAGSRYRNV